MKTVLLILLISLSSYAQKKSFFIPPKDYSLEDLDSAANILSLASDSGDVNNSTLCGIPSDVAKDLAEQLRSIIDDKLKSSTKPKYSWKECQAQCHCESYDRLSLPQKQACAGKNQWFCKSPLLNRIRNMDQAKKANLEQQQQ